GLRAEPAELDLLDREAVRRLVLETRPDALVHEATALAGGVDFKRFAEGLAPTNRLRTEGTENLLAAANEVGVARFVAQSYGVMTYARVGGPVKTEDDPLDESLPDAMRATVEAVKRQETAVLDAGGIALRYGSFYGAAIDPMRDAVRGRKVPIVGEGNGVWSLVHVADAAAATVLALERGASGVYNVADDEPAPVREVLPVMAEALGAPPPRKVPAWLAKLFAGEIGVIVMTQIRGISNRKAKQELGWTLRYPSWRQGFPATYGVAQAA
ncbi:MAG TPA: NAD(P)-dependent oxidoreductase, partial [Gaiellaceae bacterium]|nr:NAD(P)-dependent oxidoreductase [Gaiellaceae bacterium]